MTLTDSEVEYIEGILGRKMNELEEGMLDVMFSEHCSYKSSRPILGTFPTEGENINLGPGDDAGLVSVTDKNALAVGMESHNHPSAIEPYGGAGTGNGSCPSRGCGTAAAAALRSGDGRCGQYPLRRYRTDIHRPPPGFGHNPCQKTEDGK